MRLRRCRQHLHAHSRHRHHCFLPLLPPCNLFRPPTSVAAIIRRPLQITVTTAVVNSPSAPLDPYRSPLGPPGNFGGIRGPFGVLPTAPLFLVDTLQRGCVRSMRGASGPSEYQRAPNNSRMSDRPLLHIGPPMHFNQPPTTLPAGTPCFDFHVIDDVSPVFTNLTTLSPAMPSTCLRSLELPDIAVLDHAKTSASARPSRHLSPRRLAPTPPLLKVNYFWKCF